MSKISVNGKAQEVATPILISELIKLNNVAQPEMVSIQLNGQFVNREDYESTQVEDGEEVDFLYFMGGGSLKLTIGSFTIYH
jgi:sulfur carrier protein